MITIVSNPSKSRTTIRLTWCLVLVLMHFQGGLADSQEILSEGQAEAVRSIARGEGEKSLELYAARAAEFEAHAQSGASSKEYLREAARNYRLASLTARYVGNFEKSILYAERMLALSEKLGNASLKVLALSTTVSLMLIGPMAERAPTELFHDGASQDIAQRGDGIGHVTLSALGCRGECKFGVAEPLLVERSFF